MTKAETVATGKKKATGITRWPWLLFESADYFYGYSPATR